jgi:hypothetical protein
LDIWVYWNILIIHGPINVKSPDNTSKWQMGFNSAFKEVTCLTFRMNLTKFGSALSLTDEWNYGRWITVLIFSRTLKYTPCGTNLALSSPLFEQFQSDWMWESIFGKKVCGFERFFAAMNVESITLRTLAGTHADPHLSGQLFPLIL